MSEAFLEAVRFWFDQNRLSLQKNGVEVEISVVSKGDPSAVVLDFESPEVFARVTLWDNGLCDLEMLDAVSGEQISWEHVEHVGSQQVASTLDDFVRKLYHKRKERQS